MEPKENESFRVHQDYIFNGKKSIHTENQLD